MTPLSDWTGFYSALGSAAGSLTGLQFVMIAILGDLPSRPGEEETSSAFATPTIVHFSVVLLIVAIDCAPWPSMAGLLAAWAAVGLASLIYLAGVNARMRRQTTYKPEFEDWLFHQGLPGASYLTLIIAAIVALHHPHAALFAVAAAAVTLLMAGVHNAWDNATYIVALRRRRRDTPHAS